MALITCPECGAQISDKAEYCPNCGLQINAKSEKQNKSVSYDVNADKVQKKKMLGWTIGIVIACIVTLCIVYVTTRPSNDNVPSSSDAVVEENVEENFKKTLGEDVKIVAEISDSKKKRIYYLDNSDGTKLMVHDYKTKHTKTISESGLWWMDWKLAGDRLFYTTNSGACGEAGFVSGVSVFYLDTNDDSEHLVTECSEAEFDGYNRVKITKVSAIDTRADYWGDYKYESREYYLDLFASESEYEKSRQEQKELDERYERSYITKENQYATNDYSNGSQRNAQEKEMELLLKVAEYREQQKMDLDGASADYYEALASFNNRTASNPFKFEGKVSSCNQKMNHLISLQNKIINIYKQIGDQELINEGIEQKKAYVRSLDEMNYNFERLKMGY